MILTIRGQEISPLSPSVIVYSLTHIHSDQKVRLKKRKNKTPPSGCFRREGSMSAILCVLDLSCNLSCEVLFLLLDSFSNLESDDLGQ